MGEKSPKRLRDTAFLDYVDPEACAKAFLDDNGYAGLSDGDKCCCETTEAGVCCNEDFEACFPINVEKLSALQAGEEKP